jgi:hypothetical protein
MRSMKKSYFIEQIDYLIKRLEEYTPKLKGEYMQNIGIPHLKMTKKKLAAQFDEMQQELIDQENEHRKFLRSIRNMEDRTQMILAIDEVLEKEF